MRIPETIRTLLLWVCPDGGVPLEFPAGQTTSGSTDISRPPAGVNTAMELTMVECHTFIGLAYQDDEQCWRTAYSDTKLSPPVRLLE